LQVGIDRTTRSSISLDCVIFGLQRFGGISNYWARLIEHASESPAITGSLVLPKRITFSEFDARWMARMPTLRETLDSRISRYLRAPMAGTQDVFHTSYYRLPAGHTVKYVVSAYDFTYERYRRGLARWVHSTQKARSLERADAVLCISESTRRDIVEFCPQVDAGKLHVVHLGVDRDMFFRETTVESPAGDCTVLFVGQRQGYKRFDLAVAAVRQSPRLSLGIVGPPLDDAERETLRRALGERWHEHGSVSSARLRQLYSSAFAFMFPSDYEGFGLPVLEAMACGCPVVAADKASLPEVGGPAALYAATQSGEAYAAALQALESTDARARAIDAGLARADLFSWSQTMRDTFAVYRS
jgi:mannosyltransferase